MRILVVGPGRGPGGLYTHLQRLLAFLRDEGHEAAVVAIADAQDGYTPPPGVRLAQLVPHSAAGLPGRLRKIFRVLAAERAIARFRPSLFVAGALGHAYARLARTARAHGAFGIWQEVVLPVAGDPLHTEMARSVDVTAVQSPGMRAPFQAAIGSQYRTGCLPCFFEELTGDRLAAPPAPGEELRLGFFGRLAENKGLVPFLDVLREVGSRFPVRFDIHGHGEERTALEQRIAALGLQDRVFLRGRYPAGADYAALLASTHGLILPSIATEGLPLVLLEAMACGLPIFSTTIGGIPDVAIDNPDAVVVAPQRAPLAEGLERFLTSLSAGRFSNQRLRDYSRAHFSNQRFEAQWREMLAAPDACFS